MLLHVNYLYTLVSVISATMQVSFYLSWTTWPSYFHVCVTRGLCSREEGGSGSIRGSTFLMFSLTDFHAVSRDKKKKKKH